MVLGFVFDPNRCTGCQACELACQIENDLSFDTSWRSVVTANPGREPGAPVVHLSMACNHCHEPACLHHCPALAYSKDPRTGAVTVDADKCIGCRYCSWVCPYDAPRFDEGSGVMTKCTFCSHRLERDLSPACVVGCPTGALGFGEHDGRLEPDRPFGPLSSSLRPAFTVEPLRPREDLPGCGTNGPSPGMRPATSPPHGISARSEWSLIVFTVLTPVLVATFTAGWWETHLLARLGFLGLGALGMGVSTLHLGKPLRAARALLNVRRSWVSREVLGFSLFLGGAAVLGLTGPATGSPAFFAVAAAGFFTLFAMDRVYHVAATTRPTIGHSASAFFAGILLLALATGSLVGSLVSATILAILYLRRKAGLPRPSFGIPALRIFLGLVAPVGLLAVAPPGVALLPAILGHVLDRCEFYEELTITTPRHKLEQDRRPAGA